MIVQSLGERNPKLCSKLEEVPLPETFSLEYAYYASVALEAIEGCVSNRQSKTATDALAFFKKHESPKSLSVTELFQLLRVYEVAQVEKGDFLGRFEEAFMKGHFTRVDDSFGLRKGRSGQGKLSLESAYGMRILEFLRKNAKDGEAKKKIEKLLEGGPKKLIARLSSTTDLEAYFMAKDEQECSLSLTAELVKALWPLIAEKPVQAELSKELKYIHNFLLSKKAIAKHICQIHAVVAPLKTMSNYMAIAVTDLQEATLGSKHKLKFALKEFNGNPIKARSASLVL